MCSYQWCGYNVRLKRVFLNVLFDRSTATVTQSYWSQLSTHHVTWSQSFTKTRRTRGVGVILRLKWNVGSISRLRQKGYAFHVHRLLHNSEYFFIRACDTITSLRQLSSTAYEFVNFAGRFSMNAAMPSFWSFNENPAWNSCRSMSKPSLSPTSSALQSRWTC